MLLFEPYFHVIPGGMAGQLSESQLEELRDWLARREKVLKAEVQEKEDLELANHLSGKKRSVIKLSFATVADLVSERSELQTLVRRNANQMNLVGGVADYAAMVASSDGLFTGGSSASTGQASQWIG